MNIIYKLTNLTNGKYYIGQKAECKIEKVDGIDTIISIKSELPYYGSSTNPIMIKDLQRHKFKAEVLEVVNDKTQLLEREHYHAEKLGADKDKMCYNIILPKDYTTKKGKSKVVARDFQNSVKNVYGQLYKEYARDESSLAKRIKSAKKLGFDTLEEFYLDVIDRIKKQEVLNYAAIAREYGVERHTISRLVYEVDLDKFEKEYHNRNTKQEAYHI